jgi:hypothetical protein
MPAVESPAGIAFWLVVERGRAVAASERRKGRRTGVFGWLVQVAEIRLIPIEPVQVTARLVGGGIAPALADDPGIVAIEPRIGAAEGIQFAEERLHCGLRYRAVSIRTYLIITI